MNAIGVAVHRLIDGPNLRCTISNRVDLTAINLFNFDFCRTYHVSMNQ